MRHVRAITAGALVLIALGVAGVIEVATTDPVMGKNAGETSTDDTVTASKIDRAGDRDGVHEWDGIERIEEDDPRWDCHVHGNLQCGPQR